MDQQQEDNNNYDYMKCVKCKHVFHISEVIDTTSEAFGIAIRSKGCPYCGGAYHSLDLPLSCEWYLCCNTDDRYFTYPDKYRN